MTSGDLTVGEFLTLLDSGQRELAGQRLLEIASRLAGYAIGRRAHLGFDVAEDFVGEAAEIVFSRGASALRHVDPSASLEGWLRTVIHREKADRIEARVHRNAAQTAVAQPASLTPEATEPTPEKVRLPRALRALVSPAQEATLLAILEGRTVGEIAQGEHVTPQAVRDRENRGLEHMRQAVAHLEPVGRQILARCARQQGLPRIAEDLGIPKEAARAALERALRQLKRLAPPTGGARSP